MSKNKSIHVPILARVEGEGALSLAIRDGAIDTLALKIYEPPRLFEKFLEGRSYTEVLDMVARICGICPVAYQMSAAHAIESIFAMEPGPWVRAMRRLFYCGEWLESHSLHVHFLALPDFLGFKTVLDMAKIYPEEVRRGLRLQAFGNALIRLLGGRSVHPVGACIGGFFKAPSASDVHTILQQIPQRLEDCEELLQWVASLSLPDNTHDFINVSLAHAEEYPMNEGKIQSSHGLSIDIHEFENYFNEFQVPYSTALHCLLEGQTYLVGPLARVNLNKDKLPSVILNALDQYQIQFPTQNMVHSILARVVEIYYAVLEAQRILSNYQTPKIPHVACTPRAGIGFGATEAPRGLLWHRYEMDAEGLVVSSRIVPPTSQNQARIEEDLRHSLTQFGLHHPDSDLRTYSEMLIRNYDPCISCSTHFLKLDVRRA